MGAYLTEDEHKFIEKTAELADLYGRIVSDGSTRVQDITEFVADLKKIQYRVLAQAAARQYPNTYRLLGDSLP